MRTIKAFSLLILFTALCFSQGASVFVVNYVPEGKVWYVSDSDGDDSNLGHAEDQAFKTLTKLNASNITAGDTVKLKCGDTFAGSITISGPAYSVYPITITSYGTGAKPKLTGAKNYTWVQNGDVWACAPTDSVKAIWCNDVRMISARLPNVGYNEGHHAYAIDAKNTTNRTIDAHELTGGTGNAYVGARVALKPCAYRWEGKKVTASTSEQITYESAFVFDQWTVGSQIILDGLYAFFDTTNEYAFQGDSLYARFPTGFNPNTDNIKCVVETVGIRVMSNYTLIDGFEFIYQDSAAVKIQNTAKVSYGIKIANCDISYQNYSAIDAPDTLTNSTITNNTIRDCRARGIKVKTAKRDTLTYNNMTNIGMYEFEGGANNDNVHANVGIYSYPAYESYIAYNRGDSIGYSGISCCGQQNIIEYNYFTNCTFRLGEGGTYYTYSSPPPQKINYNNQWRYNFAGYGRLNYNYFNDSTGGISYAFHCDGYSSSQIYYGNTAFMMAGTAFGISIFNDSTLLQRNNIWHCLQGSTGYTTTAPVMLYRVAGFVPTLETRIYNNVVMQDYQAIVRTGASLYWNYGSAGATMAPWIADSNKYLSPFTGYPLKVRTTLEGGSTAYYSSLSAIQSFIGEANADTLYDKYPSTTSLDTCYFNNSYNDTTYTFADYEQRTVEGDTCRVLTLHPFESKILVRSSGIFLKNITPIDGNIITFNGTIKPDNANQTMYLLYGDETGVYTDSTALSQTPSGTALYAVMDTVSGLTANTTYYCVLSATDGTHYRVSNELSVTTLATVFTDNLVAEWHGEEESGTRQDATVNNNDLTENSAAVSYTTGVIGNGIYFTGGGTTNYLEIANNEFIQIGTDTSFAFTCWINCDTLISGQTYGIIGKYDATAANGDFVIRITSTGQLHFGLKGASNTDLYTPAGTITAHQTYLIACIYNATTDSMYSQVTNITASAMGTLYQTAVTNAIGQGTVEMHVGHAYNYYNIRGMIDELKMKNNGYFTSKQIEYIFRKERAGQDPF